MSKSQTFAGFCVFCYQSLYNCDKAANSSESVNKFTKLVSRLTHENGIDKLLEDDKPEILLNLKLQSCYECNLIIDGFCNYFHQFEVLQLQMNWKLEQIGRIINHCNRIPSRWRKMTAAVDGTFPNDMEMRLSSLKFVKKYRQTIEQTCRQRNLQKQPLVMLQSNLTFNTNSSHTRPLNLESNNEVDIVNNVVIEDNTMSLMSSSDMEDNTDNFNEITTSSLQDPRKQIKLESSNIQPVSNVNHIAAQHDQDNNSDAADSAEDYIQINSSLTKPKSAYQKQRYSLRHKRKSATEQPPKMAILDDDNSDDEFVPEVNSENLSSDNDTHASENEQDELPQKSSPTNPEGFQCPNCEKLLESFQVYSRHIKSKVCYQDKDADTGNMKCEECDLICYTKKELWRHQSEDHEYILCTECGMEYRKRKNLNLHLESHKDKTEWKFECSHCGKKCASRTALRLHISLKHYDDQTNPTDANTSLMKTAEPNQFSTRFECGNCRKKFKNKQVRENHYNSQIIDKFQCEFCPIVESNVIKLSTHEYQSHCPDKMKEQDKASDGGIQSFQWTCTRCQYKSSGIADYQFHFAEAHFDLRGKPEDNKCVECNKILCDARNLRMHIKTFHPERTFRTCRKSFASVLYSRKHSKKNKHTSTVNLEIPDRKLKKDIEQLEKLDINTKSKICEICSRVLTGLADKIRHLKKYHDLPEGNDKSKYLNCQVDECTAYFLTEYQLFHHRVAKHNYKLGSFSASLPTGKAKVDHKVYKCPNCGKTCKGLAVYRRHLNSEFCTPKNPVNVDHRDMRCEDTGFGNKKCDKCGKVFPAKQHLRQHIQTVHSETTIFCEKCGKGFSCKWYLNRHLEVHKDKNDWKWECSKCKRKFISNRNLQIHILSHSKKKMFKCKICGDQFKQQATLEKHVKAKHDDEGSLQDDMT